MSFAILRTAKLTSLGNVGGSARHNFRERETPNADGDRTALNRTTGAQSAAEVSAGVKGRLATQPKVRKNAVLVVEYFIGASPEWFDQVDANQREAYFDQAEKWLRDRHGAENVIAFTRQYDETSPHACAYVVPIDQAVLRRDSAGKIGGDDQPAGSQAAPVQGSGLRGEDRVDEARRVPGCRG